MTMDMISPAGDPQVGHLSTPISGSAFSKAFIQNLPAYRKGLSPLRRGLEVGMAHGYLLFGPFALTGQFRNSEFGDLAGLISAIILVMVLTLCLSLYSSVVSQGPVSTITAPEPPEELKTKEGWSEFATGFLVGGMGGALFAYAVLQVFESGVFQTFANGL